MAKILYGMQVLIDGKWIKDTAVIVEHQKIKHIIPHQEIKNFQSSHQLLEFSADDYLIPGLIDLHIHGAAGFDVMDGNVEAVNHISNALLKEGVTGFLATTMNAENSKIESAITTIIAAKNPSVLGIHLEGPFISPFKKGAQTNVCDYPDITIVEKWQSLAKDNIKLMTLAPELPQSLALIKLLKKLNIVGSIGHTNADYHETMLSIQAGASYATHLFNAMKSLHHREPGAVGALLLADNVYAELILDDLHLHAATVKLAHKIKGIERLLLVSDAMRAKCMPDGEYELGGAPAYVKEGKATLADGTLAGSTLQLPTAINNFIKHTQCSLAEAIQLATINPARVLGIENQKGSITMGKDADLVVLSKDLQVKFTMRVGEDVYSA